MCSIYGLSWLHVVMLIKAEIFEDFGEGWFMHIQMMALVNWLSVCMNLYIIIRY